MAHPLAEALVARLRGQQAHVLEIGSGRGRNTAALHEAGFEVQSISDADAAAFTAAAARFDAALSTHAFLHGTPASVARLLAETARALKAQAPLYCTFGSKRDARYGTGARVDTNTYAPESGEEAGVAHVYFDKELLRSVLERHFAIESLQEERVDHVVGSWAHAQRPSGSVHWFVIAHKRED